MNDPTNKYFRYLLIFMIFAVLGWYYSKEKELSRHRIAKAKIEKPTVLREEKQQQLPSSKTDRPAENLATTTQKKAPPKRSRLVIRDLANTKNSKSKKFESKYIEYFEEEEVSLAGRDVQLSSSLVAYPKESEGKRVPLFRVGNFNIFEESIDDPLTKHHQIRVAYNKSTKKFMLLTGLIFIRLSVELSNDVFKETFLLNVEDRVGHLNLVVTRPLDGVPLQEVVEKLKNSELVESYEIELLEGGIHAK